MTCLLVKGMGWRAPADQHACVGCVAGKPCAGTCQVCREIHPLNANGKIAAHGLGPKGRRRACDGQARLPLEAT